MAGRHLVFKKLVEQIESQKLTVQDIILVALVLDCELVRNQVSWCKLRNEYNKYYRDKMLDWFGFDTVRPETGRIPVVQIDFIIALFSGLKQYGILGNCTYNQLGEYLYYTFDLHLKPSVIISRLKKFNDESSYYASIQSFMKDIKKIKSAK